MDEDFRSRLRHEGNGPQPQFQPRVPKPSQPAPVTDLRPLGQRQPAPTPSVQSQHQHPAPQPHPAPHHMVEHHRTHDQQHHYPTASRDVPKRQTRRGKTILTAAAVAVLVTGGGFFYHQKHQSKTNVLGSHTSSYFPATLDGSQVDIPVYYPVNLPAGFKVSGFKVIKQNVLYYVVTNKNNDSFYITIQPLPASFDFVSFAKKFPQPDQYNTPIGTDLVGVAGNQLLGSIQTNKNTWIILNSTAINSIKDMETITRSFQPVSL